jgi:nitroimidazol reductase NimA-like FMN-containing flavoprotein (pyridoxamine 5'-phosphate oxidase superfamily)
MNETVDPVFRDLDRDECEALLKRQHVGRIAFLADSEVDIEPIGYVYLDGWLFGRTSHGAKIQSLGHKPWVAFEVDEIAGPFDWRSVVARGSFHRLYSDGSPVEQNTYKTALRALRAAAPATLTPRDPTPHRSILFGVHIDTVSGRAATAASGTHGSG